VNVGKRRAEHVEGAVLALRCLALTQHDDHVPVGALDVGANGARALQEHADHVSIRVGFGEKRCEHVADQAGRHVRIPRPCHER
jgi:hypothetical protein